MASGKEIVMVDVLARLKAAGAGWMNADRVRRAHRTAVPREGAPATHLIDGDDTPKKEHAECQREGGFTVSIFLRSDEGPAVADPYVKEVMRRLSPQTDPYDDGVTVYPGKISLDPEIGDKDPLRVDMEFGFCYPISGEWSLGGT